MSGTRETSGGRLEIQQEATAEAIILRLSGEIDLTTTPMLSSILTTFAEEGRNVIADLSGLEYIDSTGFKAILAGHELFAECALRLVLSGPSTVVRKIIDIMRIDKVVSVFSTVEAAREFMCTSSAPQTENARTDQTHRGQK